MSGRTDSHWHSVPVVRSIVWSEGCPTEQDICSLMCRQSLKLVISKQMTTEELWTVLQEHTMINKATIINISHLPFISSHHHLLMGCGVVLSVLSNMSAWSNIFHVWTKYMNIYCIYYHLNAPNLHIRISIFWKSNDAEHFQKILPNPNVCMCICIKNKSQIYYIQSIHETF